MYRICITEDFIIALMLFAVALMLAAISFVQHSLKQNKGCIY